MSGRSDITSNFSTSSTATSRAPQRPKPMTMQRAKALRQDGPDRCAPAGENREKGAAGPPRQTEFGDPMREGQAGLESERLEASEKIPPASTAVP